MKIQTNRVLVERNFMIYGQFLEHFHRQVYGGVFDPGSPLSDEKGLRQDVLAACKQLGVPVIRWPGGCFVSAYHWREGVGLDRQPSFDKAWRVEEPNTFGTAEFYALCEAMGADMYLCSNAGTGTMEEMSDWLEYCNLETEGRYAKARISHGNEKPFGVKYFSIGNENYGMWEIGSHESHEWGRLVAESAKMLNRVDPTVELSAAALPDSEWNLELLKQAGPYLKWISLHEYWDPIHFDNALASYEQVMAYTADLSASLDKVIGILAATGYLGKIRIAYDEWNLRGWYHPSIHSIEQSTDKADYLYPRDDNDDNSSYTMADTVFTACVLNMLHRYAEHVRMANYAPVVNTRGLIYTHKDGLVKRGTYHVFDLFASKMGETVVDAWEPAAETFAAQHKNGQTYRVSMVDAVATLRADGACVVSLVNKHPEKETAVSLEIDGFAPQRAVLYTINGNGVDDYNDVDRPENICIREQALTDWKTVALPPHSVNVVELW